MGRVDGVKKKKRERRGKEMKLVVAPRATGVVQCCGRLSAD